MAGEATVDDASGAAPEPAGEAAAPVSPPDPPAGRGEDGPAAGPPVRVHRGRLERRVAPMDLSPTEALRLAEEGRAGLSRRELPPDVAGDDPGGSGGDTGAG